MFKVKPINAISLDLKDVQAVFTPRGEHWNGLREFICISPETLAGEKIIVSPNDAGVMLDVSRHWSAWCDSFGVLLASEKLADVLRQTESRAVAEAGAGQGVLGAAAIGEDDIPF